MVQHWRLDCVVPGDAGVTILWDSGNYSPYETVSHHRKLGGSKVFAVYVFMTSCNTSGVITEPVIFTDKSGFGFRFLTLSSCITAIFSLVFVIAFIIYFLSSFLSSSSIIPKGLSGDRFENIYIYLRRSSNLFSVYL